MSSPDITFTAPGAGAWELDRSHFPGGTTPIAQWLMEGMPIAMRTLFAEFGTPAETLEVAWVHGFMYTRLRPLVGADRTATKAPPALAVRLLTRLHPVFRARTRAAVRTLRERPWRQVIADWHATTRPRLAATNLAFQDVAPDALDDDALADHLAALLDWCRETTELHFRLHGFDLGPIGLLLQDCERWGIPATDVIPALGGASPSTTVPARLLAGIRDALREVGAQPASLDDVRAASPDAATRLDEYLRQRGSMLVTRYDLDGQTLAERPDTVLASILHGAEAVVDHTGADRAAAATRARVPEAERALFDERLAEARAAMDLRDDNGPCTIEWPYGLLHRALLALGQRLVERSRLQRAEHAFELHHDEVVTMARTGAGPSAAELAARAEARAAQVGIEPPARLGPEEPAPPMDAMPEPLRVIVGAVQSVLAHLGMAPSAGAGTGGLAGVGIGARTYQGRARVATSPEAALDAMEPGDVLVVRFTTPAYNTVLSIAGAIVTADGGPLCHAAVMARELGLPAVIGAPEAMVAIADGSLVEVDPVAGVVRVLAAA